MVRPYDEIKKEMDEIKILKEKAEEEYKEALKAGFKKHKECCPDICDVINQVISKLNTNIDHAKETKEKSPSTKLERALSKSILIAEAQVKELEILKDELYAKSICNCK